MSDERRSQAKPPARGRRPGRPKGRRGVATVELAICLPVLLITALGMIEVSNVVFVQARSQAAAYEAVRYATRPTTSAALAATATQVTAYCTSMLAQLGVNGATVTVTPANLSGATPQTLVTVSVSVPLSQNTATSFVVSKSMNITTQATLVVE